MVVGVVVLAVVAVAPVVLSSGAVLVVVLSCPVVVEGPLPEVVAVVSEVSTVSEGAAAVPVDDGVESGDAVEVICWSGSPGESSPQATVRVSKTARIRSLRMNRDVMAEGGLGLAFHD